MREFRSAKPFLWQTELGWHERGYSVSQAKVTQDTVASWITKKRQDGITIYSHLALIPRRENKSKEESEAMKRWRFHMGYIRGRLATKALKLVIEQQKLDPLDIQENAEDFFQTLLVEGNPEIWDAFGEPFSLDIDDREQLRDFALDRVRTFVHQFNIQHKKDPELEALQKKLPHLKLWRVAPVGLLDSYQLYEAGLTPVSLEYEHALVQQNNQLKPLYAIEDCLVEPDVFAEKFEKQPMLQLERAIAQGRFKHNG